ncbi:MAG: Yip1 family protein [Solibacillus sp.]
MNNEQLLEDRQPILSIATKPRETIQLLLQYKSFRYFIIVGLIGTFASQLGGFIGTKYPRPLTLGDIVLSSMANSVLFFFLATAFSAGMYKFFGLIFKGKGSFKDLFKVVSLATIPYIWILPLLLFWMQLSPETYFVFSQEMTMEEMIIRFTGGGVFLIFTIWSAVITIVGVSEVHKISKWKAFFVSIIGFVIIVALLFVGIAVFGISYFM